MISSKRILITGGGGFIGTSLAERLVAADNEVVLCDVKFSGNSFEFSGLDGHRNIRLAEADILDSAEIEKLARDAEIIVHMAAQVGVREVIRDAAYTLDVNYIGTSNLLKIAAQSSCCERFIMMSTSEIFGSNSFRVSENGNSLLSSVEDVRWCYCVSKLAGEQLAFSYYRQKGVPAVVIRPFNIFGPRRVGDHVVIRFILRALANEDLEVYGDGTQIRAWCYIDDICNALLRALEVKGAVGQAFNIGNPLNTCTIYGLARTIVGLCGSKSRIVFKAADFTDIDLRVPNIRKASEILGFAPQVELEEGLVATIQWTREHFDVLTKATAREQRDYVIGERRRE